MTIVEYGKNSNILNFECTKCGCKFKASRYEYRRFYNIYDNKRHHTCNCPVCNQCCDMIEDMRENNNE